MDLLVAFGLFLKPQCSLHEIDFVILLDTFNLEHSGSTVVGTGNISTRRWL